MRKLLTVLGVVVIVSLIVVGWLNHLGSRTTQGGEGSEATNKVVSAQWCPQVELIAVPGTWEASAEDDPLHPTFNELSLLGHVTRAMQAEFPENQVRAWTVPYPAEFKNVLKLGDLSYDDSQAQGFERLAAELKYVHDNCPGTEFMMIGFSQGAAIVGDMTSEIAHGRGPIPASVVRAVAVVADPRQIPGEGINPGAPTSGVGAEVALQPVQEALRGIVPGATMRGARPGGFGELSGRVWQLCVPGDAVCDMPISVGDGVGRAAQLLESRGVHGEYGFNLDAFGDKTILDWLIEWSRQQVSKEN